MTTALTCLIIFHMIGITAGMIVYGFGSRLETSQPIQSR
jgi:hypothetical protein